MLEPALETSAMMHECGGGEALTQSGPGVLILV